MMNPSRRFPLSWIPVLTLASLLACSIDDEAAFEELASEEAEALPEVADGLDDADDPDDFDAWQGSSQAADEDEDTDLQPDAIVLIDRDRIVPGEPLEILADVFVLAPAPGEGVTMEILYDGGDAYLVDVEADARGDVTIRLPEGGFTSGATPASSCSAKCTHKAYKLLSHKWNERLNWYYRDSNRPSSVGKQAVIDALKYSASTITASRNACDMSDQVSATHKYQGTTSTAPNISYSKGVVSCLSNDDKSVIGWGSLPSDVLAATCTWRSNGIAVSTDARYNRSRSWFAGNSVPSGCKTPYSLRAVAAHEWGHSFGLNHTSCHQTMAPSVPACQSHRRRLGKGDVLGLRKLY